MSEANTADHRLTITVDRWALYGLLIAGGLGLAFAAGYMTASSRSTAAPGGAAGRCGFELPLSQSFILAEFSCPDEGCDDALLDCHCNTAHSIKTLVKDSLRHGSSSSEVRSDVEKRYGDALLGKR